MCYYDSWFEENWCEEPREEEMALIEAIKENVKQDIKQEMERLRKENAELQQYKKERQKGKNLMGTFISDLVLQILSFVAESERENIRSRQAQGIAAAKARGIKFGRPKRELPDNFDFACALVADSQISKPVAARACGLPLTTFVGKMKERDKEWSLKNFTKNICGCANPTKIAKDVRGIIRDAWILGWSWTNLMNWKTT